MEGEELFKRLNTDGVDMDKLKPDYDKWIMETKRWLAGHDLHAAVHFENKSGMLGTHGLVGGSDVADYLIDLDTRLARLGEIMATKL
jgi:hypothetical protein